MFSSPLRRRLYRMGGLCAVISVMLNLARYLAIAGVGIWVGSRPRVRSRPLAVVDRIDRKSVV